MRIGLTACVAMFVAGNAAAQGALPTEYPPQATGLKGEEISNQMAGKVFTVKTMASGTWRLEFNSRGYLFLDTDSGYSDTGTWRVEDNQWCANLKKTGGGCSELRAVGEVLYYRRGTNGEVVSMTVR